MLLTKTTRRTSGPHPFKHLRVCFILLLLSTNGASAQGDPWWGGYIYSSASNRFYVLVDDDIYSQNGSEWEKHGSVPDGMNLTAQLLEVDPQGNIWFSSGQSIYRSEDQGVNWSIYETMEIWPSKPKVFNNTLYFSKFENGSFVFYKKPIASEGEWTVIPSPFTGIEDYIVAPDGEVYVSEYLFKVHSTVDEGQTWQVLGGDDFTFPNTPHVLALNGDQLLAGLYFTGIWTYDDETDSWSESSNGLPLGEENIGTEGIEAKGVRSINISPTGDIYVLVSDQIYCAGVYRSTDNGASYSEVPIPRTHWYVNMIGRWGNPLGFAIDDNHVYINSLNYAFMYKEQGAGTWEETNNGRNNSVPHNVTRARQDDNNAIWALMEKPGFGPHETWGIMKSTDGGESWSHADSALNDFFYSLQDISVTPGGTIFASGYDPGSVHRSTDGGVTWERLDTLQFVFDSIQNTRSTIDVLESANEEVIFAGSRLNGLFRSVDSGDKWDSLSLYQERLDEHGFVGGVKSIVLEDSTLIVVMSDNELWSSSDLGDSWDLVFDGDLFLQELVKAGETLFARDFSNVYRSDDGGVTWIQISNTTDLGNITGLTVVATSSPGGRLETNAYELVVSSSKGIFTALTTDEEVSLEVSGNYTGAFALPSGKLLVSREDGVQTSDAASGVDLSPPEIQGIEVSDLFVNGSSPLTVSFDISESLENNPIVKIGEYDMTLTASAGTTFTYSYSFTDEENEGEYTLEISASDNQGNTATVSYESSIVLDKTAPEVIEFIISQDTISTSTTFEVVVTTDEVLNESPTVKIGDLMLNYDSVSELNYYFHYEYVPDGQNGLFDAVVGLTDLSGNVNEVIRSGVLYIESILAVFTSDHIASVDENSTGEVINVDANEPGKSVDEGITYSLSGADAELFSISENGSITFINAPDHEDPVDSDHNNIYHITVSADNGNGASTQDLEITVINLNDNTPEFTSENTISVEENNTFALTLDATDADGSDLSFSISGGPDGSLFALSGSDIAFINPPDFEEPSDENHDNVYEVEVQVSDDQNSQEQFLTIQVTNSNDNAPVMTSDLSVAIRENKTEVLTLTASDPDGSLVTFSIDGGADSSFFTLTNEDLSFTNPPELDNPLDENGDNVYEVGISASDGLHDIRVVINVTVEAALSIDEKVIVQIYPNPTEGAISLKGIETLSPVNRVSVIDLSGKLILEKRNFGKGQNISLRLLPDGVYTLVIESKGVNYYSRIIKR